MFAERRRASRSRSIRLVLLVGELLERRVQHLAVDRAQAPLKT
jgi:hypothetical protein